MSITELKSMMPPPAVTRPFDRGQWTEVEDKLGTSLPHDYKDFIDAYGGGRIAGFISVFSPFSTNENMNTINQLSRQTDVLRELASLGEALPYSAYPADGGIFPISMTDNGDVIYWNTGTKKWSIVVNEAHGPEWEAYDLSLVDFLTGILSGKVTSRIFPKLPLATPIKFVPSR